MINRTIFAGACVLAAAATPALAQDNSRFEPMQLNDPLYNCEQLLQEAGVMEDTLGAAPAGGAFAADAAIGLGTDLALRAGGAGAAKALGALGGFGGLARGAMERQQQAEEERKALAEKRWFYLAGLYEGKACNQAPQQDVPPPPIPAGAEVGPQPVQ